VEWDGANMAEDSSVLLLGLVGRI